MATKQYSSISTQESIIKPSRPHQTWRFISNSANNFRTNLLDEVTLDPNDPFDDLLLRVLRAPTEGVNRYEIWLQHLHTEDRTALGLFEDAAQLSGLWGIRNSFPRPDWSYLLESKSRKDFEMSKLLIFQRHNIIRS